MQKTLFVGLNAPPSSKYKFITHLPFIEIHPKEHSDTAIRQAFEKAPSATHLIFTSQMAAKTFTSLLSQLNIPQENLLNNTITVAVGKQTATLLHTLHFKNILTAKEETAEGVVEELKKLSLKDAHIFWPHSSLSRDVIKEWVDKNNIKNTCIAVYDTLPTPIKNPPTLSDFDEVVFTSPSTVDAFLKTYKTLPQNIRLTAKGPVTAAHLKKQGFKRTP